MDFFMYVKAFVFGGLLCLLGEILILKTRITPAKILVIYIVSGVLLSAFDLYAPFLEFAGAGASVPLTGFGHALSEGVKKAVHQSGLLGALTGGLKATAGGITAAIFFGTIVAFTCKPRPKNQH